MKKDNIRDYATEAFRLYARLGEPTYEGLKEKIYQYALREERKSEVHSMSCISNPTETQIRNAQNTVDEFESCLMDVLAVDAAFRILETRENGPSIKAAVEMVYFVFPDREIRKGEIQERARRAALAIFADERTVYRYLKIAREIFAKERGLSIGYLVSSRFRLHDILVS